MFRFDEMILKDSCDSLGTRWLPERTTDRSVNCDDVSQSPMSALSSDRRRRSEMVLDENSDESIFVDSDLESDGDGGVKSQCTLAIIKPEAARLMYKIESVMERNGFIVKTVRTEV